ncbi:MAG: MetQ/NlpA family ABC transporter substrate-binding protein, partial [Streptococcus mitis]|nr:MetQ/NlpA family ABC transporter substrate-binding protein [Streptococcus mitis]
MKKLGKIALGLALLVGLSSCGNKEANKNTSNPNSNENSKGKQTIKIGVVGEYNDVLNEVIKRYKDKTGNDVKLVVFSDYNQPNEALKSGDIDLNAFQHKKFLED